MKAIILAAGVGLRLQNLTRVKNKAFLSIGGMPIIEQMIRYLLAQGIQDITVVTGHCSSGFDVLLEQYPITLIYNRYYSLYNNIYSIQLALKNKEVDDTYIIHGDIALYKNIFKEESEHSFFISILHNPKGVPTRHPVLGKGRKLNNIELRTDNKKITTLLGISYWKKEDMEYIKQEMDCKVNNKIRKDFYGSWEDSIFEFMKERYIEVHQIDSKYAIDINCEEDYFEAIRRYEKHWK